MMEDAHKKAKRASMPIANNILMMMASVAVLTVQCFLHKVDEWEGLPACDRTWRAWKVAFRLAHLKRQLQLQVLGGGKPLGGAYSMLPVPTTNINQLGAALNNLALTASNNTTVSPPTADSNQLDPCGIIHHTHCGQQEACRHDGHGKGGLYSGGNAGKARDGASQQRALPPQLLLDPCPLVQPEPHECNLWQQSHGAQGQCNNRQHNGQ